MAAGLAATPASGLRVQLCGVAHLSNFGAFASPERNLVFDVNDFGETLPGPFEWDVKRLVTNDADGNVTITETGDHLGRKGLEIGGGVGLVVGLFAPRGGSVRGHARDGREGADDPGQLEGLARSRTTRS